MGNGKEVIETTGCWKDRAGIGWVIGIQLSSTRCDNFFQSKVKAWEEQHAWHIYDLFCNAGCLTHVCKGALQAVVNYPRLFSLQ